MLDAEANTINNMKSFDLVEEETARKIAHEREASSLDSNHGGVSVQVDSAGFPSALGTSGQNIFRPPPIDAEAEQTLAMLASSIRQSNDGPEMPTLKKVLIAKQR